MPSTAVSKYRTAVKISTGTSAAKTPTAITKANPVVLTASSHGLTVGTVVVLSGIGGMTELNGLAAVITAADTNTMTLGGIDSTGFTTFTSGGSITPQTMTTVENVTGFSRASDEAEKIDSTNLQSTKKEYIVGLSGEGNVTISVDIDATGPGQAAIRSKVGVDTAVAVEVIRSDAKAAAMMVKFTAMSEGFPDKHSGEFSGVISGQVAWYA